MAVYVLLIKDFEDDEKVIYRYGPNKEITGKIEYNKKANKLIEIEPIVKDGISNEFYVTRAAQRLAVLSIRENAVFPERTSIES